MLPLDTRFATLQDLLRHRAQSTPAKLAYVFLKDALVEECSFTYAELDRRARAIAVSILDSADPSGRRLTADDRALLVYPPGIEFVAAFFGCLYAGVLPIPAPPPEGARLKRTFPRLQGIIADADARLVLTSEAICQHAHTLEQNDTCWLSSDTVDLARAELWQAPAVAPGDLAYLQYTSGSTSSPKGVMLTHRGVLRNLAMMQRLWEYDDKSISVTWMPYFHDYGMVDGLLQPIFTGIPCYVLSPLNFIKRPQRWLEAISRYRGTHTQAPNFAYELCVNKIRPEQRDALDLSTLKAATNGAEPVRESTYLNFAKYFAPCGFRPTAYIPSYGLAEATLLVTSSSPGREPIIRRAEASALEREQRFVPAQGDAISRSLVSCGGAVYGMLLAIVDPETMKRCAEGAVGEIWVSDPSIAVGYWNKPEANLATFDVRLADEPESAGYLRTGDQGFLLQGELYITGRLKDLIIIAGVNHYPQDIEWTVTDCHPDIRPDHCAAFSVEQDGEERLVVIAELVRELDDWQPLFDAVRRVVSESHELELFAFVALQKGGIFKTSSGKLQRRDCRAAFLEGRLELRAAWQKSAPVVAKLAADGIGSKRQTERLADWLIQTLARRLALAEASIDPREPFASYGMTSRIGVELVGDLEQWLGRDDLSPTLLWEYPSIAALSAHLSGVIAEHPAPSPSSTPATATTGAIAIVGMACRLPGAETPDEFWQMLAGKREAIRALPAGRWQGSGVDIEVGIGPGRVTTLHGGFLPKVDEFDAELFGIGPREAEIMDPQQRLLLEVAWEAFENAGLNADALAASPTGVFVGISTDDYSTWQLGDVETISAYTGTAKALSIAANRISYVFDFTGPSMAIDTACSSSLVAIHLASHALRRGECSMALAGGVNLILAPQMSIALSQAGMLAADGRCKTFDSAADGYARGEGCVLLVLKRLEDALRDGDRVAAILRGSAVNQDGRSNGLTAPNGLAQQRVVRQALLAAGVRADEIAYVETHGTGTPLGDPIEVKALRAVLGEGRGAERRCALGAVKANIGHLEAAAGVAGVLKTVLSLQHGEIAPHPTLKEINPLIELSDSPFHIPTELSPWPAGRRLAGVSSFGFGGTNAHLVLEAAPPADTAADATVADRPLHLLTLSARDSASLRALAQRWAAAPGVEGAGLADRCFSANTGRTRLAERLTVCAADGAGMLAALNDWLAARRGAWLAGTLPHARPPRIAFLFTGQGAQYVGMGRELYETQPGFRRDMDECNDLLQGRLGNSLIDLLYRAEGAAAEERLAHTEITQPVLFALEYSLARLWMRWGVQPVALLGHSIGEYVAATLAGVFSLADGLRLVAARARLMHAAPGDGAMVSVVADEAQCLAALAGFEHQVVIGVYNGPRNHVLSGERAALDRVVERLVAQGIEARPLKVSHAFHSPLMDPVLEDFAAVAKDMQFRPASISVYSNISGSALEGATMDAAYWVAQLRSPVRFAEGVRALQSAGIDAYIEIGPRPTLLSLAQQSVEEAEALWLPSLRPRTGDTRQMLDSLAKLYLRGAAIDWRGFDRDWPRRRVPLPTYPFQRRRYWLPPVPEKGRAADAERSSFPGRRVASPLLDQILFENRYDTRTLPWLGEHRVFEQVVVPGAAHLSLVLQAAESFFGASPCVLQDVIFPQALVVPEPGARRIQLSIAREPGKDGRSFTLISLPAEGDEGWEEHASGRLSALDAVDAAQSRSELADLQGQCAQGLSARFYEDIWQSAIDLGPRFRWVDALWRGENQILARLIRPAQAADDAFRLHPGLLDSALQVLAAAVVKQPGDALVPFSFEQFRWFAPVTATELWSHVRLRPDESTPDDVLSDVRLYAADGRLIAEARGFRARRVASRNLIRESLDGLEEALYALRWEEGTLPACPATGTWLVLGEAAAATQRLADCIAAQAAESGALVCLQAHFGAGPVGQNPPLLLPLDNASALEQSLRSLGKLDGIVLLAGMEAEQSAADAALVACSRVLHLVQALVNQGAAVPRLILATRGAHVGAGLPLAQGAVRADQAALWGLTKVVRLEHPELKCTCVDLGDGEASFPALARLLGQTDEADLILSDGRQWLPKLQRYKLKSRQAPALRDDAAYLISGGLGALGLQLAEWLARHGARHLILIGRRGPSAEAVAAIEALTGQGVKVTSYALDIADPNALAAALAPKDAFAAAIAGVFHLAGVLDDGMLQQQDRGRFAGVFAPKLGGALNLHQVFAGVALDHFVCFSSVAGLTGSMGQGSYAAANAALDALMAARRAAGLAGLSLQWGPWADAGMAAMQDEKDQQRFAGYGIDPINTTAGMNLLGHLLGQQAADSAAFPASVAVLSVHWPTYLGQLYGGGPSPSMYLSLGAARPATGSAARTAPASDFVERLGAAAPGERRSLLETYLRETIAGVMGLADPGVITPRQRLFELGLDSLGAVELRNWLAVALGRTLRATLIFDYPTLGALADHLEQDVLGFKAESEAAPALEAERAAEQLDSLSDDELAKLLADELGA